MGPPSISGVRRGPLARAGATAWQLIGIVVVVILTGWAAGGLMPVLLPIGIALLLAALLRPVQCALERGGLRPALAALLTLACVVAVVGGLMALVVPTFVSRLADLTSSVHGGVQRLAYSLGHDLLGMDHSAVDRVLDRGGAVARSHLGGLAGDAVTGASAVASVLAAAVLVVFLCFFMLKDGARLWAWIVGLTPEERRPALREVGRRAWAALATYARGVIFVATIDAVFIGLALVLVGVPLALPLIMLTWLGAFFPIVGAVTAGAAAVLVALVAKGLVPALIVLASIVAVQQIEGNVLYPVLVGPRLKLHPVVVLLAVAAGGTVAGLAGAFLAVPVATVGAAVLNYLRDPDERPDGAESALGGGATGGDRGAGHAPRRPDRRSRHRGVPG